MHVNRRSALLSPTLALPLISTSGVSEETKSPLSGAVILRNVGARLDGATDDSKALQAAILLCLSQQPARPLIVDGPCYVGKTVFIDRMVDKMRGIFRIVGLGHFGGFIVAGDFPLFDSNLEHKTQPMSEHIWFENIRFEASMGAQSATVMSDRFLRIRFNHCEFEGIKVLSGKKYAQEWHFAGCLAQRWPGILFQSYGGYHIVSHNGKYQNGGGTVFEIFDPSLLGAGCVGCSFHQDVAESNTGSFLKAAVIQGLSISGLYSEGNEGPALDFDSRAPNRGISISGSMFSPKQEKKLDKQFFDIHWGRIEAGYASGNFSTARLHYCRKENARYLTVQGDYAAIVLQGET